MPAVEDQLRAELKRVAETVQPGQLRPLRVPVPGSGWRRWLLPVAAAAATAATIVAAVLASAPSGQVGVAAPALTPVMPRYYVTVGGTLAALQAVVRESANGHVTGAIPVPIGNAAVDWSVTAAADGRTFVIAVDVGLSHLAGTANLRFFRLEVSADGRPGNLAQLPESTDGTPMTGMALSPDGTMLALSLEHSFPGAEFVPYGSIEVINLVTGATRTWTGQGQRGYYAGRPTWGNDGRTITFTWWYYTSLTTGASVITGVRELDTAAPGGNLLASRLTSFQAAIGDINSALITSGGRAIVASSCRDVAATGGNSGSAMARVLEFSAADGRLVRVLRTQVTRFPNGADEQDALDATCSVLSADATGQHVLVQAFNFGRIDSGEFTALPGASPHVLFVAAAW